MKRRKFICVLTVLALLFMVPLTAFGAESLRWGKEPPKFLEVGTYLNPEDLEIVLPTGERINGRDFSLRGITYSPSSSITKDDREIKVWVPMHGTVSSPLIVGTSIYEEKQEPTPSMTKSPKVDPVQEGSQSVTGKATKGAKILLYDQDGYLLSYTWAYSGTFDAEIGRPAKQGEILQVYAWAGSLEKSRPTKVVVGNGVSSKVTPAPTVDFRNYGDSTITGKTLPDAVVRLMNGHVIEDQRKADSHGFFRFSVPQGDGPFYVQAIAGGLTPSIPVKAEIRSSLSRYIEVYAIVEGDSKVKGHTDPSIKILISDKKGLLGTGMSDAKGNFTVTLSRKAIANEVLKFRGESSSEIYFQDAKVLPLTVTSVPVPATSTAGATGVAGKAEKESILVLRVNGKKVGEATASKEGYFEFRLPRPLRLTDVVEVAATAPGKTMSPWISVAVEEAKEVTGTPVVDPLREDANELRGRTEPYAEIRMKDEEGNVVALNWAGPSGNFGATILRRLKSGEKLKVTAQGKDKLESEPVTITVDKVQKNAAPFISGYEDGTFRPENTLTRGEAAAMFARLLLDGNMDSSLSTFKDVQGKWFEKEVSYLHSKGYMNGYPGGLFKPERPMTRGELAAMIAPMFKGVDPKAVALSDIHGHWAEESIKVLNAMGIIEGYPGGEFRPDAPLTRAQAAKIFNGAFGRNSPENYNNIKSKDPALLKTFKDVDKNHWAYYDILLAANQL